MTEAIRLGRRVWSADLEEQPGGGYEFTIRVGRRAASPKVAWRDEDDGSQTVTFGDNIVQGWWREKIELQSEEATLKLAWATKTLSATVRAQGLVARILCTQVAPRSWTLGPWTPAPDAGPE